jgi:hypothetical protein
LEEIKNTNQHFNKSRDEYIEIRNAKNKTLNAPKLILPSVQVNLNAGVLPPAESNGISYLKFPVNLLGSK